jgi:hypothetical protein
VNHGNARSGRVHADSPEQRAQAYRSCSSASRALTQTRTAIWIGLHWMDAAPTGQRTEVPRPLMPARTRVQSCHIRAQRLALRRSQENSGAGIVASAGFAMFAEGFSAPHCVRVK